MDGSVHTDKQAPQESPAELFRDGFLDAFKKPLEGVEQLTGQQIVRASESAPTAGNASNSIFRVQGEMLGQAIIFYAAATAIKNLPHSAFVAPVAAGGVLGLVEPVQGKSLTEHIANGVRGAATMTIMDKMPAYLAKQGFRGDFVGNALNVFYSGAIAGAADTNMESLLTDGKVAAVPTTVMGAVSWGAMASMFHVGSLFMNKGFRAINENRNTELLLFGPYHEERCSTTRDFLSSLGSYGIRVRQVDLSKSALKLVARGKSLPLVLFPDGSLVSGMNTAALARNLNLHTMPDQNHYRVGVVGAGPGGIQTAINAASELKGSTEKVAVVAEMPGGQASRTSSVKNFMGFPDVTGRELMTQATRQAQDRGAELIINRVIKIEPRIDGTKNLILRDGNQVNVDAVVLATGMNYRQLEAPGMERLSMKGVYTLADAQEAPLLKGQRVFIVGAGNSAGQAAINLSSYAKEVNMVVRGSDLSNSMSQYLIDEIKQTPNIKVQLNSQVASVDGTTRLESVTVKTVSSVKEELRHMSADAMYVYIGGKPNTRFLKGGPVLLDEQGFVLTGNQLQNLDGYAQLGRQPLEYETSMPGVFAIGDVRSGNKQKRIMSATGDAGKAIGDLHEYLRGVEVDHIVPLAVPQQRPNGRLDWSIRLPSFTASLLGGQLFGGQPV